MSAAAEALLANIAEELRSWIPSRSSDDLLARIEAHFGIPVPEEGDPEVVIERTYWFAPELGDNDYVTDDKRERVPYEKANLVSSLTESGLHAPVLDLDFPATLLESSSPGHFHLYLEREIEWDDYAALLAALAEAGILEPGYVHAMLGREATFVRRPGVFKKG